MDVTRREISKIAREVNTFTVRALREEGIGTAEFEVIHAIRKNPGITQAAVCRLVGMDKGAVARQTANLEAKAFLTRQENPDDGRSQLLFPTQKAEQLKNSKAHIEALFYEWLLEGLPDEDRQTFARLLEVLYLRCKAARKHDFMDLQGRVEEGSQNGA